jgi:exopolyphosphatase / guanosine-5'-triphosphate,3'-diphosphate pyrophosphatase
LSKPEFDAEGKLLAAIDLGSNSFHMVVARVERGEIRLVERLAENVQLAAGMANGQLHSMAIARGLECLSRFRQALDVLKPDLVRIIGTNSLRVAKNRQQFRHAGEAITGHPLEIISGREEARLVYLGVAHTLADDSSRLVVDIGGGSTEFIIGERFEPRMMESLHMGCVNYGERFFANGKITRKAFEQAYLSAYTEVLNIRQAYKKLGWIDAVGSSGTLRALESVIAGQGWATSGISADNLGKLRKLVLRFGSTKELADLPGLSERRRDVFVSGLAIASAFFDALDIKEMRTSTGALREGIIYDTIGRLSHEDVRERSVVALMQRYSVDEQSAAKVEETARYLFDNVRASWNLRDQDLDQLVWACRLHDVGLAISHSGFHKHGQYLVENSDLAGFSTREQIELGLLIRGHRQKIPTEQYETRANGQAERLLQLCLLLRLAVLLKYITQVEETPVYQLKVQGKNLSICYPVGWLEDHPLTCLALTNEQDLLARRGIVLKLESCI